MGCGSHGERSRWKARMAGWSSSESHGRSEFRGFGGSATSSGNRAFDEYREATLKRLEEEQREFRDFLENLRHAKDRAEFDQFMASRKSGSNGGAHTGGDPQAA